MMKAFILSILSLICITAYCEVNVALLGANNIKMEGSTQNYDASSYMQDGLVAMWDGIENVDFGIHSNSTRIWKDLVGQNDLTLDENVVWEDKCTFQANKLPTATRENSSIAWVFAEVVCDWSLFAGTSQVGVLFSAGLYIDQDMPNVYGNWLDWYNSGRTKYFCHFCATGRPVFYAYVESSVSDASKLHGTISIDKTTPCIWIDAVQMEMISQSISYFYNVQNTIFIGANNANGERGFIGRFYSIRLYSRILSDEEIQHNYIVDRMRFKLR